MKPKQRKVTMQPKSFRISKPFRRDNMSSLSCTKRLTLSLSRSFARSSNFSSSPIGCAQVSVETDANGIAILSMNKAPVNSLNTEFIQELTQAVIDTEKTAKVIFICQRFKGYSNSNILGHRAHLWKQSVLRWSWHHGDVPTKPGEAWDLLGEPSESLACLIWLQTAYDSSNHRTQVSIHLNMQMCCWLSTQIYLHHFYWHHSCTTFIGSNIIAPKASGEGACI